MTDYVTVAQIQEVPSGQTRQVEVDGKSVLLVNLDGDYFAIDATCTHRGGPLAEGEINGEVVTCPWHRGGFNVRTGEAVALPTTTPVGTYPVRVTGSALEIDTTWANRRTVDRRQG